MAHEGATIAILVISAISVSAYQLGCRLSFRQERPDRSGGTRSGPARSGGTLLFGLSLVFCLVFCWCFSGNLHWAKVFPSGDVIHWANLVPVSIAFAAGLSTWIPGLKSWSRPATVLSMSVIGISFLLVPIARPLALPAITSAESQWDGETCLQTHEATCAAAAAATLLNLHGVARTEREMVAACLTSQHGTEPLGLYRGLKLAGRSMGRIPRVAAPDPDRWIQQGQLPCVALVRFQNAAHAGPIGWLLGPRGEGHAIVVLERQADRWLIADPAIGKVHWSDSDFRRRFTGDAIYLEP